MQMKKPLGELACRYGLESVAAALFVGFLTANLLKAGLGTASLGRALERFAPGAGCRHRIANAYAAPSWVHRA